MTGSNSSVNLSVASATTTKDNDAIVNVSPDDENEEKELPDCLPKWLHTRFVLLLD